MKPPSPLRRRGSLSLLPINTVVVCYFALASEFFTHARPSDLKGFIRIIPATKPPICANQATPPPSAEIVIPLQICKPIHIPNSMIAGIRITVTNIPKNTRVFTLAKGYRIKYAPRMPDIAPLAPTMGICELKSVAI